MLKLARPQKSIAYSQDGWTFLIFWIAFFFGFIVRFFPGFQAGFPLNDGGMFLSMIRDLGNSHYALPLVTSYNALNIPYAYPPFGFYIARLLADFFSLTEISLLRWLPPAVSTLSIFVFYKLGTEILESRRLGAIATIFYALTPGASAWFIMGGGLTRSFGSMFMLLSIWWIFRLFRGGGSCELLLSVLFCTLTVLSHPEVGVHTALVCFLIWLFYGHTFRTTLQAMFIGASTLILSSPWWGTILFYHGATPFLSALNTGALGVPFWHMFIGALFAHQAFIPILPFFRVVGFVWGVWRRKYFLILWVIVPFLVEPRSAPSIVFYPFCMLVALTISEAIPSFIGYFSKTDSKTEYIDSVWLNNSMLILIIYLFIESCLFGFKLINNTLTLGDREAMTWIQKTTPRESRFLSITGVQNPEIDPFVEWFPALTKRRNQTTVQGLEWLLGAGFYKRYDDLAEVQICKTENCIATWSDRTGLDYDYIAIRKPDKKKELTYSMSNSDNYVIVYSTNDIVIYSKENP